MSEITSKVELKPCPLCGCPNILLYAHDPYDGYQGNLTSYRVRCQLCGLMVSRLSIDEAVERWNKRFDYTRKGVYVISAYDSGLNVNAFHNGRMIDVAVARMLYEMGEISRENLAKYIHNRYMCDLIFSYNGDINYYKYNEE